MKTETDLAVREEIQPSSVIQAIMQLARDKDARIDVIERMFALQERLEARQRETSFYAALTALQSEVPLIVKHGKNNHTGTRYAKYEDMHAALQPLLAAHGFATSFNEEYDNVPEGMVKFSMKLSHRDGFFEVKSMTVPIDESAKNSTTGKPVRTGIQDAGSTASYARRYLYKMHLNIAEKDEDTDGNSTKKITPDQAKDLQASLEGTTGMDKGRFFIFMGVGAYDEIKASDWKKALNAIDTKRRENESKGIK